MKKRHINALMVIITVIIIIFMYTYLMCFNICSDKFSDYFNGFVAFIVVLVGTVLVIEQLQEAKNANKMTAYNAVIQSLQTEEMRYARKKIHELNDSDLVSDFGVDDYASKVCASFDTVGVMVKNELLDPKLIENWDYTIMASYKKLEKYISKKREERGDHYWNGFTLLYENAEKNMRKIVENKLKNASHENDEAKKNETYNEVGIMLDKFFIDTKFIRNYDSDIIKSYDKATPNNKEGFKKLYEGAKVRQSQKTRVSTCFFLLFSKSNKFSL